MIKLERLGTEYGGWVIPEDLGLSSDSIIYSAGAGEDISFDLLLQSKTNCNIFLIDPTPRSKVHYNEIVNFYRTNQWNFSGDIQPDYQNIISRFKPNLDKIIFLEFGLWSSKDILKFFKHDNPVYVSQTLVPNMFGDGYDEVNVDSVKNIMIKNNHNIDLLKMDIEGAEIAVLNQMLDDEIYPKYLCVEFDLYLKGVDKNNKTNKIVQRLSSLGYEILFNHELNVTFLKK